VEDSKWTRSNAIYHSNLTKEDLEKMDHSGMTEEQLKAMGLDPSMNSHKKHKH